MALVRVKTKFQVTLPDSVRKQVGINVGDLLETKVERGKIMLVPKAVVDRDEYTTRQRRVINARLSKSLEDLKKGRSYGPFHTADEMIEFLHGRVKTGRRPKSKTPKPKPR